MALSTQPVGKNPLGGSVKASGDAVNKNYLLFDKFVNVEFERAMDLSDVQTAYDKDKATGKLGGIIADAKGSGALAEDAGERDTWNSYVRYQKIKEGKLLQIVCPMDGPKPHISVQATFLPQHRTTEVTVTIRNMETEININDFQTMRVSLGYINGLSDSFSGPIVNCYMESPNPNGSTVFQLFDGGWMSDFLLKQRINLDITGKVDIGTLLKAVCNQAGVALYSEVGVTEGSKDVTAGIYTNILNIPLTGIPEHIVYNSYQQAILDIYGRMDRLCNQYRLATPRFVNRKKGLYVVPVGKADFTDDAEELVYVKSVSFSGGAVIVKAPFDPIIKPLGVFKINPAFFRGRLNAQDVALMNGIVGGGKPETKNQVAAAADSLYRVVKMSLSFDTMNTNDCTVTGVAAGSAADSEEMVKAIEGTKEMTMFGGNILPPPYITPSYSGPLSAGKKDMNTAPTIVREGTAKDELKLYTFKKGGEGHKIFGIEHWNEMTTPGLHMQDFNGSVLTKEECRYWYLPYNRDMLRTNPPKSYTGIQPGWRIYARAEWPEVKAREGKGVFGAESTTVYRDDNVKSYLGDEKYAIESRIVVGAGMPQETAPVEAADAGGNDKIETILAKYQKKPFGKKKTELSLVYGWTAKEQTEHMSEDVNVMMERVTDWLDIAGFVLLDYPDRFKADGAKGEFDAAVEKIRTEGEVPEFFISRYTMAIFSILAQRDWWEGKYKDSKKAVEQQMPKGYDVEDSPNDLRVSLPTQPNRVDIVLAFPDWEACLKNDDDVLAMLGEVMEWCKNNRGYKQYVNEFEDDIKMLGRLAK